jgi:hypothetical protein
MPKLDHSRVWHNKGKKTLATNQFAIIGIMNTIVKDNEEESIASLVLLIPGGLIMVAMTSLDTLPTPCRIQM